MWATWASLPKKKEKINKSWKMMIFDHFEGRVNFVIFWPTTQNFQKYAPSRRNFCRPQNSGNRDFRYPKTFRNQCACFFGHILISRQFYSKFHAKILVNFEPLGRIYIKGHRGVSEGRWSWPTSKKYFSNIVLNSPQKVWKCSQNSKR